MKDLLPLWFWIHSQYKQQDILFPPLSPTFGAFVGWPTSRIGAAKRKEEEDVVSRDFCLSYICWRVLFRGFTSLLWKKPNLMWRVSKVSLNKRELPIPSPPSQACRVGFWVVHDPPKSSSRTSGTSRQSLYCVCYCSARQTSGHIGCQCSNLQ